MKLVYKISDKELLENLKAGKIQPALDNIYHTYRDEFLKWSANTYHTCEEEAADVYQDTIIAFYLNTQRGILTELTSSLKTYLFTIGKNLLLKKKGKADKFQGEIYDIKENWYSNPNEDSQYEDKVNLVSACFHEIKEPCKSILRLFYYEKYSMEKIAIKLNYKNENVVKSKKVRCMKSLKEIVLTYSTVITND